MGRGLGYEETVTKPKPMVEIGGMPIIWHIMKIYSSHGINEFVICCGYKGYIIKEYFANYFLHSSDVTVDIKANSIDVHEKRGEPWKITLIDTERKQIQGEGYCGLLDILKKIQYFVLHMAMVLVM